MKDNKSEDSKYYPNEIEAKWQTFWEAKKIFSPDVSKASNPYYNLMMFPYPSAEGLHVGNMYAFTGADVYAKFQRMQGKDVLEPIGLDGFGIHSENYALKIGKHPLAQSEIAEKNFYRQLRSIGNSFDWQRTVETYDPNYYKWTQWLFIQLFKKGLAYRDTAMVNWCPKDLTVLSDEQVIPASPGASQGGDGGVCERCGTKVAKKNLEQWFFRITKYAERLLNNIEGLQWTERVKIAQRNWIGKSEGAEISFEVEAGPVVAPPPSASHPPTVIKVFTTRPDTLFGATFMVVAPEHEIIQKLVDNSLEIGNETREEVKKYVEEAKNKTDIERTAVGKEKTGVFSGLYAINPVNNEKIPVWVADYVLSGYGTGAIMAVPAHDVRDFEFAKKYNLPVIEVIKPAVEFRGPVASHPHPTASLNDVLLGRSTGVPRFASPLNEPYEGAGILINSGEWDGFEVPTDMDKVLTWLEGKGLGRRRANYHLRDWLISRQRYWGPPIPIIYCRKCWEKIEDSSQKSGLVYGVDYTKIHGLEHIIHPVPEAELPVMLPDVSDWKPMGTGKSPLANHPEFYNTKCPNCGSDAKRETDVSDTFLDSAWYFLRYPSTDIEKAPFDTERTRKWLPVDQYIGGAEHSVLHLLYSRFVTQVLKDLNFIDFEEPFTKFFAHGLIIKDGAKMSKSKGNVVVPDEYIAKYGADTLRTYLMFIGPYSDGGDFRDSGIEGMNKFLRKVWKLLSHYEEKPSNISAGRAQIMMRTIKKVTEDISTFSYNTAIASLMEWYNYLNSDLRDEKSRLNMEERGVFLHLLAPFAPHMTEELWQSGDIRDDKSEFESIHLSKWPEYDEKYLFSEKIVIPVQINGKRRAEVVVSSQESEDRSLVEEKAKESVSKHLVGNEIKKVIYVPGKIINFVI